MRSQTFYRLLDILETNKNNKVGKIPVIYRIATNHLCHSIIIECNFCAKKANLLSPDTHKRYKKKNIIITSCPNDKLYKFVNYVDGNGYLSIRIRWLDQNGTKRLNDIERT